MTSFACRPAWRRWRRRLARGHPVDQGAPAEWEDFTDTDLVVRDNPSTLADGQEIAIRPERPSVVSLTPDP